MKLQMIIDINETTRELTIEQCRIIGPTDPVAVVRELNRIGGPAIIADALTRLNQ